MKQWMVLAAGLIAAAAALLVIFSLRDSGNDLGEAASRSRDLRRDAMRERGPEQAEGEIGDATRRELERLLEEADREDRSP